jgi:hypothetical protein
VKITARITGTADLARLDVSRLVQRLVAALERDLQPTGAPSPRASLTSPRAPTKRGEGRGEGQRKLPT